MARLGHRVAGHLTRVALERNALPERVVTAPNLDDDAENQARWRLLTQHRGYGTRIELFDGFPDDVRWQWMAITPAELARVRYIDYDYWVELSGGTRLAADAAPRIRAAVAPFGVPSDWALGMAQEVAAGARFPPLILVTTGAGGDLVVLEGHARLTAFMLARDSLPPELEVLVGSSPAMTRHTLQTVKHLKPIRQRSRRTERNVAWRHYLQPTVEADPEWARDNEPPSGPVKGGSL